MLNSDRYETGFPVSGYRVDAVLHDKSCKWYVVEAEEELSDIASQVVKCRALFYEFKKLLRSR